VSARACGGPGWGWPWARGAPTLDTFYISVTSTQTDARPAPPLRARLRGPSRAWQPARGLAQGRATARPPQGGPRRAPAPRLPPARAVGRRGARGAGCGGGGEVWGGVGGTRGGKTVRRSSDCFGWEACDCLSGTQSVWRGRGALLTDSSPQSTSLTTVPCSPLSRLLAASGASAPTSVYARRALSRRPRGSGARGPAGKGGRARGGAAWPTETSRSPT
jgi:hypothetical protein